MIYPLSDTRSENLDVNFFIANDVQISGGIGATITANAPIVCGIGVGRSAMVGAGCAVTGELPEYRLGDGSAARIAGRVNEKGDIVKRR
ncbi:MAG: hypothetical protein O3B21_05155 [Proteobacteria bacterium]|nr:hypothetical protein [Pseudomonadota bacterium]MDA1355006.1 hypothetical protein [Pseudomonadota bacterium]